MSEDGEFTRLDGGVWSPVFTLPKNEKKLYSTLTAEGVPAYLPLLKHVNIQPVMSKGKSYCYKRVMQVPMFRNYVFANITPAIRAGLGRNRSVIRILPVTEYQEEVLLNELKIIRSLERFSENEEVDVTEGVVRGTKVRFTGGQFVGWEGVVLELNEDGMAYINITSVEASVKIKYPAVWCRRLEGQDRDVT